MELPKSVRKSYLADLRVNATSSAPARGSGNQRGTYFFTGRRLFLGTDAEFWDAYTLFRSPRTLQTLPEGCLKRLRLPPLCEGTVLLCGFFDKPDRLTTHSAEEESRAAFPTSASQIDHSVLEELPSPLQRELQAAMKYAPLVRCSAARAVFETLLSVIRSRPLDSFACCTLPPD